MQTAFIKIFIITCSFLFVACKESYEPLAVTENKNYLVVEGFINTAGTTTIKLSRTLKLSDTTRILPEQGAIVTAEGDNNNIFLLQETGNGNYTSAQVFFPNLSNCRLRIKTASGKEYLSAFVPVKPSPEIDSINWERTPDGVRTYVNTHDPLNNTRYYLWEYQEDWEFRSKYQSLLDYVNGQIIPRDQSINISTCWNFEKSTRIITGTSYRLGSDVIRLIPITYVPNSSWKISVKYSVMVRQYPLTKEGFEFWENVKKNSEQLGTIFDPMPSQTAGNLKCLTVPEETVIGFISAGSTREKRIFINHAQVLPWPDLMGCFEIIVTPDSVKYYFGDHGLEPEYAMLPQGYKGSTIECIDCTLRGSNIKPPFWP